MLVTEIRKKYFRNINGSAQWRVVISLTPLLLLLTITGGVVASRTSQPVASQETRAEFIPTTTIRAAGLGNQLMHLNDGYDLAPASAEAAAAGETRSLSLASADFDGDGLKDVVSGYGVGTGGRIVLHRRNAESLNAGRRQAAAFDPDARVFDVPAAPDFLAAADFNEDRHQDLIFAARNASEFHLMKGDGKGGFAAAQATKLPGAVTTLIGGDVNSRDGRPDLVVGITNAGASQALVFAGDAGGFAAQPEQIKLPAAAVSMAIGTFDEDHLYDLAIAAGHELIIRIGRANPTVDRTSTGENGSESRIRFASPLKSVAPGNLAGDRRPEIVALAADGLLHSVSYGEGKTQGGRGRKAARWAAEALEQHQWPRATGILGASVSAAAFEDLVVLDGTGDLHILTPGQERSGAVADTRSVATLEAGAPVVAGLSMRLNGDALSDLVLLREGKSSPTVVTTAAASIIEVINTDNSGKGSLRQAIVDANSSPGADEIRFNIAGAGVHTIAPASELPAISEAVTIDGFTQPDSKPNSLSIGDDSIHLIEISGANAGLVNAGLTVRGGDTVIRGLVINRFKRNESTAGIGIQLDGETDNGGNVIEGNFIGPNPDGRDGVGNEGIGVQLDRGAAGAVIGDRSPAQRNVISANQSRGLGIGCHDVSIVNNYIGVDATGETALGNRLSGITALDSDNLEVFSNLIGGNLDGISLFGNGCFLAGNFIGVNATGSKPLVQQTGLAIEGNQNILFFNLISGNSDAGVRIAESSRGNGLLGNRIGTDIDGTRKLPNAFGVVIDGASDNVVRENLISGNDVDGIAIIGGSRDNVILENLIGLRADGIAQLGNAGNGVLISESSETTVEANHIGGNDQNGINIESGSISNSVDGNFIGTDGTGALLLGNKGNGIRIAGSDRNLIGLGAVNVIGRNEANGVLVEESIQSAIAVNRIFGNGLIGIDLGGDGPTDNDEADADTGANNLQNFPSLTAAILPPDGSEETLITGSLNSEPGGSYFLFFFANDNPDSSGFGEGERFVGAGAFNTDEQGNVQFSFKLDERLRVGSFISAVAFNPLGGDTSEFSKTIAVTDEVADVSVSLSANPTITPGQNLDLAITLTNNGPKQAAGVVVQIDDDSIGFAPIAAGASVTVEKEVSIDCGVAGGMVLSVRATVSGETFDPDSSNNTATVDVTAVDPPPVIDCPDDIKISGPGLGQSRTVDYTEPVVTDNCPGSQVACNPPSGAAFPIGATTVTCTATDSGGATASCSFTVTVVLFDLCVQDDSNGKILRFSSATGEYEFLDCRKGFVLTGRGVVTTQFGSDPCKVRLADGGSDQKRHDRNVAVLVNVCTKVADATVQVLAQGVTHTLRDNNTNDNACACQ